MGINGYHASRMLDIVLIVSRYTGTLQKKSKKSKKRKVRKVRKVMGDEQPQSLNLQDKTILCVDCLKPFLFTTGEQGYFLSKDLSEPKRCPQCRLIRKLTLNKGM